ncbi:MAG: YbbR-like domain-containing protein [Proteobacteria bacterium]|nr:YbbR-like domain-containing protein [Desulfobulbaceae bacterium]MBU4153951.1 YbbR-like domain-containing protein [Pseudomonadota bacterium]
MIPYTPPKLSWPKDWFIKLLSLLFALFLWYFVSSEDRVDINVQIPVEIVNLPRDLIISNQYKTSLDITVSGPRGLIRKISPGITRSIDLSKATPGNMVIANEPDSISVPRGVTVLRITPTHITLSLDRLIKKTLAIKPISHGKLPEEYELKAITIQPETLDVTGPQDILGDETIIQTNPIDLSDITASTSKQISLDLKPEVAELIGASAVSAHIEINDKLIEKDLARIEISPTGLTPNLTAKLVPSRLNIRVLIPMVMAKKQSKTLGDLFSATVNLQDLPAGNHDIKPVINGPPEVTIQKISPESVGVMIQ